MTDIFNYFVQKKIKKIKTNCENERIISKISQLRTPYNQSGIIGFYVFSIFVLIILIGTERAGSTSRQLSCKRQVKLSNKLDFNYNAVCEIAIDIMLIHPLQSLYFICSYNIYKKCIFYCIHLVGCTNKQQYLYSTNFSLDIKQKTLPIESIYHLNL